MVDRETRKKSGSRSDILVSQAFGSQLSGDVLYQASIPLITLSSKQNRGVSAGADVDVARDILYPPLSRMRRQVWIASETSSHQFEQDAMKSGINIVDGTRHQLCSLVAYRSDKISPNVLMQVPGKKKKSNLPQIAIDRFLSRQTAWKFRLELTAGYMCITKSYHD